MTELRQRTKTQRRLRLDGPTAVDAIVLLAGSSERRPAAFALRAWRLQGCCGRRSCLFGDLHDHEQFPCSFGEREGIALPSRAAPPPQRGGGLVGARWGAASTRRAL